MVNREAGGKRARKNTLRGIWLYALLQVPGTVLAGLVLGLLFHWGWLSAGWALVLFLGWVVKDWALYPVLRDTFTSSQPGADPLVGTRGVVEKALAPHGLVRLGGELWQAEAFSPERSIAAGMPVVVRSTRGLTLLVEEATAHSRNSHPLQGEDS